jgi:common-antigen outer membrane protein
MSASRAAWLAVGALAGSMAVAQSNLGDFKDSPSAKFTPQDFEMFWATVDAVSVTRKPGTAKNWENTDTGSGGTIKLLNVFTTADGRDCRRLKVDNHAKKAKGSSKQIVCVGPDGKWTIDADARPAPKS